LRLQATVELANRNVMATLSGSCVPVRSSELVRRAPPCTGMQRVLPSLHHEKAAHFFGRLVLVRQVIHLNHDNRT